MVSPGQEAARQGCGKEIRPSRKSLTCTALGPVPYAGGMLSRPIGLFFIFAAAALLLAAYASRAILLGAVLFALLCAIVIGVRMLRAGRERGALLHDPAVSTLVFPPESKFRRSVSPPR
jgi:hypothetical protein